MQSSKGVNVVIPSGDMSLDVEAGIGQGVMRALKCVRALMKAFGYVAEAWFPLR